MPILKLGRVQAGEPFVEQKQLRARRQRAGELDAFLVDIGELRAEEVRPVGETDPLEQRVDLAHRHAGSDRIAAEHPSKHDVLARRHAGEDADELKRACDAGAADLERARADDLLALEVDRSGVGRQLAGDQVEHRRLAGAVRADQAGDAAGRDIEGKIAHGDRPPNAFLKTMDAQHRAGWRATAVALDELWPGRRDAPHEGVQPRPPLSDGRRRVAETTPQGCRCRSEPACCVPVARLDGRARHALRDPAGKAARAAGATPPGMK